MKSSGNDKLQQLFTAIAELTLQTDFSSQEQSTALCQCLHDFHKISTSVPEALVEKVYPHVIVALLSLAKRQDASDGITENAMLCLGLWLQKSKQLPLGNMMLGVLRVISLTFSRLHGLEENMSSSEFGKGQVVGRSIVGKDDLLLSCISVLLALTDNIGASTDDFFSSREARVSVGHVISELLDIMVFLRSRSLRTDAVKAVYALCTAIKDPDILAAFFPGIMSGLSKVLQGDYKQGHELFVEAIRAFAYITSLVMSDAANKHIANTIDDGMKRLTTFTSNVRSKIEETTEKEKIEGEFSIHRDREWVASSQNHLHVFIPYLEELVKHQHWKVRLALVDASYSLLSMCNATLVRDLGVLLNILVGLSVDEMSDVKESARQRLRQFNLSTHTSGTAIALESRIEENMFAIFTRLPTVAQRGEGTTVGHLLRLCAAYFDILGDRASVVLDTPVALHRFCGAILTVLELDVSTIQVVQQGIDDNLKWYSSVYGDNMPGNSASEHAARPPALRKSFKYFVDTTVEQHMSVLCISLVRSIDVLYIFDHLLSLVHQAYGSQNHQKEAVLAINMLIDAAETLCKENTQPSVVQSLNLVVEEYLSSELFSNSAQRNSSLSIEQRRSNILVTCLMLEGVGKCALALRKDFAPWLTHIPFPLLEKLGDPITTISDAAWGALLAVCRGAGVDSVHSLVLQNSGRLVDCISHKLQYLHLHIGVVYLLKGVVWNGGPAIIQLVGDTLPYLYTVVASEHCGVDIQHAIVQLMLIIVQVIRKGVEHNFSSWDVFNKNIQKKEENVVDQENSVVNEAENESLPHAREYFTQYHHNKEKDDGSQDGDSEIEEGDDGKVPMPDLVKSHMDLASDLLEHCRHFMSSESIMMVMTVLDILEEGVPVLSLSKHTSKNLLMPLINKIWPSVVHRLHDLNPTITLRALSLVGVLVDYCGDFVSRRLWTDLTPILFKILDASTSHNPFAKSYQLCKASLQTLIKASELHSLATLRSYDIAVHVAPYLSNEYPAEMQAIALSVFAKLNASNSDATWLLLMQLAHRPAPPPPHPFFSKVSITPYHSSSCAIRANELLGQADKLRGEEEIVVIK